MITTKTLRPPTAHLLLNLLGKCNCSMTEAPLLKMRSVTQTRYHSSTTSPCTKAFLESCKTCTSPTPRCITTSTAVNEPQQLAAMPQPKWEESCSHVVYKGPGEPLKFESGLQMPRILKPTDVVIKVLKTTICGTDVHILSGNVSSCQPGTRLGHEGIGEIVEVGYAVENRRVGDRVLVNTTTQCGECYNCKQKFHGHCADGGWQLGNIIDGMQGTYARIPHADYSTQLIPEELWDTSVEDAIVMCSDILPTGLEVGLLDGNIQPGMKIAIVGMGPVGLASLITSGPYKPSELFAIDINNHRLQTSTELKERTAGLESVPLHAIDNSEGTAVQQVLDLTNGLGVDLVVEAIGVPVGWYICQDIVKAGGHIAMLGVHGKSATINLERMWHRNFRFSAGLVHGYSIPMLVNKVVNNEIPADKLISHKVPMSKVSHAYDLFKYAAQHSTLKVLLENDL